MALEISEDNLKHGLLGLVIALVEIVKEALKLQALARMEDGSLEESEIERLSRALQDLEGAIEAIKCEQGVSESVKSVRDGLDRIVDDVVDRILNPRRWEAEAD